ncbi:hypothetical protein ACNKHS_23230 [Shigella flexneri]
MPPSVQTSRAVIDYLPKPFDIDEAVALVERAISHYQEQQQPRHAPDFGLRRTSSGKRRHAGRVFAVSASVALVYQRLD